MGEELGHRVVLEGRKRLVVTGVSEVLSFEEDGALLRTAGGTLAVRGAGLQLKQLTPDGGQICVEGTLDGVFYEGKPREGGFWARLFG